MDVPVRIQRVTACAIQYLCFTWDRQYLSESKVAPPRLEAAGLPQQALERPLVRLIIPGKAAETPEQALPAMVSLRSTSALHVTT